MSLLNLGLNIIGFQVISPEFKLMITASFSKVSFGLFKISKERFIIKGFKVIASLQQYKYTLYIPYAQHLFKNNSKTL
tara:strand:- start:58 stop:291 length:234 start_codon:yes stop_codon:yes gene_type:complete